MATSLQTIRRLTIEGRTTGVKEATDQLSALSRAQTSVSKSADGMAVSTDTSSKRQLSAARSYDTVRAKVDDAYRSQVQYQRMQGIVDKAFNQGAIDQQEYARTSQLIVQRFGQMGGAANDNAKKIGLNSYEMKNLGFQVNDVATMLASGSSPFQVMATQSGQVLQILQGSNGGISGAIKGMGASAISFLGPLGLMATGFAAVGVAAYAFYALTKTEAPTAEKLLAEHDRLLKVVKDSYDKVTNSAKNWYDQSKAVTQLQLMQQEIDMRKKLTEEVDKSTRKLFEVDFANSGNMSLGYKVRDEYKAFSGAIYDLAESYQKGTPNVKEFTDQVAKIAIATPALQKLGAALVNSVGDASKFATVLQQTKDMLDGLNSGKFSEDQRGRLNLPEPAKVRASVSAYESLIQRTKDRIEELKFEATAAGQTMGAVEALRLQHEAERAAKKAGTQVNQQLLDQLKSELILLERQKALRDATGNADFQRQTMFMPQVDQQVAQTMRTLYGDEWQQHMDDALAKQMRMNALLMESHQTAQQFTGDFVRGLMSGKSVMESLASAAQNLSAKMADKAITSLFSGDFVSAGIQGSIALISGLFAADQKKRAELKKAKAEWEAAGPAFEAFLMSMTGGVVGSISQAINQARSQMDSLVEKAAEAEAWGDVTRLQEAFNENTRRIVRQFWATYTASLAGLNTGMGSDSPFLRAVEEIKSQLDQVKGFIDDTKVAFSDPATTEQATQAAQKFMLSLLSGADEMSAIQSKLFGLQGSAAALQGALVDLGMSADQAADAIAQSMQVAVDRMRRTFEQDLWRDLADVSGKGYLNDLTDLVAKLNQRLADAAAIGYTDIDAIYTAFNRGAQGIIDGASLTGDAFLELMTAFPQLAGAVHEFTGAAEEEAKRLQEEAKRAAEEFADFLTGLSRNIREFIDNFRGGSDTNLSPSGRLSAAQSAYNTQLGLAQGGNRDAANGLTQYADRLIESLRAMYGSSSTAQSGINAILNQLEALPGQISSEQYIVNAIVDMKTAVTAAIGTNNPTAIATALSTYFNQLDSNLDGKLTYQDMVSALGNNFTTGTWASLLARFDRNGDGVLDRLETVAGATEGTNDDTSDIKDSAKYLFDIRASLSTIDSERIPATNLKLDGIFSNITTTNTAIGQLYTMLNQHLVTMTSYLEHIRGNTRLQNSAWGQQSLSNIGWFKEGGFTGYGGVSDVAGIVHKGEYVNTAADVNRLGIGFFDSIRAGKTPAVIPNDRSMAMMRGGANDNRGVEARLDALVAEVARLRQDNNRVTVAAAEHVGEKVEGVSEAIEESQRDARNFAA